MRRLFVTAVVLACWASVALPASAAAPKLSKDLWATINVCDTLRHDNMMGVRASMSGDGAHTKTYMRFTAQYYDRASNSGPRSGAAASRGGSTSAPGFTRAAKAASRSRSTH